jgi:hypothetical protein
MLQLTDSKTALRAPARRRHSAAVAAPRSIAHATTQVHSSAPALTLAAVVVLGLVLAAALAIAGALGA